MAVLLPQRALDFVAPYCDIIERLESVPPSAKIRGLYLRNVITAVEKNGKVVDYRKFFPEDSPMSMGYWPLGGYLLRLACAGALIASPERIHDGMYEVSRGNSTAFAKSLLGRALIRLLSRDPVRLIEQGLAARRQSVTHGQWELRRHRPNLVEMVYHNEYIWIESAIAGAAQGTFEACGLHPTLKTSLRDRFNGATSILW